MTGIELAFWRAIGVYRVVALVYSIVLLARAHGYSHPLVGWLVIALMTVWTAATVVLYGGAGRRGGLLLVIDLAVCTALLMCSRLVQAHSDYAGAAMPVTAIWVGGPVLAWGVQWGRRAGAFAAVVLSIADFWQRGIRDFDLRTPINGAVLLLVAGTVIGHVADLARQAETRLERAVEMEAAGRERERLARGIHDSVLQVLALVQRRGQEIGGEAAELGRLAGEQEAKLRELVRLAPEPVGAGVVDLRESLRTFASPMVTVSVPATPLLLGSHRADELAAAVAAALGNVRQHCGPDARAWILAELERDTITVTVRDDGPGIATGRLATAAADGRIGVTHSIRGRIEELGGTVKITSGVGPGTEVEMMVPCG